MVGANGFEPSTSWSRTIVKNYIKSLNRRRILVQLPLLVGLLVGLHPSSIDGTREHCNRPIRRVGIWIVQCDLANGTRSPEPQSKKIQFQSHLPRRWQSGTKLPLRKIISSVCKHS
jgi:hypothetical protein